MAGYAGVPVHGAGRHRQAGGQGGRRALKEIAAEETEHQDELAERLASLGGEPPRTVQEIGKIANAPFPNVPKDRTDLDGMIKTVLQAEAGAIEVYDRLAKMCHQKDHVTYILGEEVEHEDKFEQLVK